MLHTISRMMDRVSGFLATRKGLLPFLGIFFVALNFLFRLAPLGWFSETDFFLHLGVILAIFGFTLAWAL